MYIYNNTNMEKNSKVMLWGLEKATSKMLKEYEGQNNNPKSTIKKKKEDSDAKLFKKFSNFKEKTFDPSEDYGIQDLPFLKKESQRIDKEIEKDIDYDENIDLQDKIYELIETLEEMSEKFGSGLKSSINQVNTSLKSVLEPKREQFEDIDSDTSDDEYGKGLVEEKTKSKAKNKKVSESKIRAEKGSDKAKEIGQKLAEARRKKREETGKLTVKEQADKKREEKQKLRDEKAKPWYYVGIMPKGYREATEDEAIKNNKVGIYGKYVIDPLKYEFHEKYNILLSHQLTDTEIRMALLGIPKKINRSYQEIEIFESKLENNKYTETEHHKYDNKLAEEKHTLKNLKKAYNWIYKLYCERNNKTFVKKSFPPPEKEEVIPSKSESVFIPTKKETLDPRTKTKDNFKSYVEKFLSFPKDDLQEATDYFLSKPIQTYQNRFWKEIGDPTEIFFKHKRGQFQILPKEIKVTTHNFENEFDKIAIPMKAFTKDMILKPKYAKKLFDEKKILLHPEHYQEEDIKKYFYRKSGTGIGSKDAQKLISIGYKPEMSSYGEYELDPELSIDRARVYKNTKTGKAYVVHRGTKEATDWLNNLVYGLSPSMYRYTNRYKTAKDVQEKALKKYGDVDVVGHSQGAKLAEMLSKGDKRIKDVITYNRPVGLMETLNPLDKNVTDVRSSYDPVSVLAPFQKGNKPVTIENKSWNPLTQHNTSSLLENPNQDLGNMQGEGIVKRKPDPSQKLVDIVQSVVFMKPHWNVTNAIKWLKQHNYYNDEIHDSKTQIRFRQYNPEDLKHRHFISKKLKDENILLIISTMSNRGSGFMVNNVETLAPKEVRDRDFKEYYQAQQKYQKENEKIAKETEDRLKAIKKATKDRVKKGSKEAKDKMAKVRAGKGLKC